MSSETAVCVYCGEQWKLADGMCHKCQNGASQIEPGLTEQPTESKR